MQGKVAEIIRMKEIDNNGSILHQIKNNNRMTV